MQCIITLPEGVNPGGLVNIKRASKITGIDERTIRHWLSVPGNGLKSYKVSGRIHLRVSEFLQWIERNTIIAG